MRRPAQAMSPGALKACSRTPSNYNCGVIRSLICNITGLKQDHGVALANELGRGFISDGGQEKVIIFESLELPSQIRRPVSMPQGDLSS